MVIKDDFTKFSKCGFRRLDKCTYVFRVLCIFKEKKVMNKILKKFNNVNEITVGMTVYLCTELKVSDPKTVVYIQDDDVYLKDVKYDNSEFLKPFYYGLLRFVLEVDEAESLQNYNKIKSNNFDVKDLTPLPVVFGGKTYSSIPEFVICSDFESGDEEKKIIQKALDYGLIEKVSTTLSQQDIEDLARKIINYKRAYGLLLTLRNLSKIYVDNQTNV